MKYALIQEHIGLFNIALMCRVLAVSRSGYYRWFDRPKSHTEQRRETMEQIIADTYEDFQARYGAPRLVDEIKALGYPCSTNYVGWVMHSQINSTVHD